MKSRGIFLSICLRIIPLTLTLFFIVFEVANYTIEKNENARFRSKAEADVSNIVRALLSRNKLITSIITGLAQNDIVINSLVDIAGRESYIFPFMQSYKIPSLPNARVSLLDYRGRVIASNFGEEDYKEQLWIGIVMNGQVYQEIDNNRLIIAAPVLNSGKPDGMIVLELKKIFFYEFFFPAVQQGVCVITGKGNQVYFNSNKKLIDKFDFFTIDTDERFKVSQAKFFRSLNLKVFSIIPKKLFEGGQLELQDALFVIVIICFTVLFIVIYLTARTVTTPLKVFLNHLKNKTEEKLPDSGLFEFKQLANAYNKLVDKRNLAQKKLEMLNRKLEKKVQKRTKELQSSNKELEKLARIVEKTDNAVVLTDCNGCIEWVNEGFTRISEYSLEEVKGKRPGHFLQGVDTDPETVRYMSDCFKQKKNFHTQVLNYSKSGKPYWLDLRVQALKDNSGKIVQFMAIQSDITNQKKSEEQIKNSEARMKIALQAGEMGVWEWSLAKNEFKCDSSQASLLGISNAEALSKIEHFIDVIHPEDKFYIEEELRRVSLENPEFDAEFRIVKPSKEEAWLIAKGQIALNDVSKDVSIICVTYDITKFKKAYKIVEKATRAKSDFLANMSHELRTPMNSIIGFTKRLLMRLPGQISEKDLDALETVSRNSEHLLGLINDILDISKIEAGKMTVQKSNFELMTILTEVIVSLKPLAESKGIKVSCNFQEDKISVYADRTKVTQILLNILSNSIKYTDRGSIEINASLKEEIVEISVKDTGTGIKEEDLARLFTKFTQVSSQEHARGGTGLGLAITKEYVEMHSGHIYVESEWKVGSKFIIKLPIVSKASILADQR